MKNLKFFAIIIALLLFMSCSDKDDIIENVTNETKFKQKMRQFVIGISQYSKNINPNFNIVPQNGIELVSTNGENTGEPSTDYLNAIDGNGQEDLFYGYDNDDQETPVETVNYLKNLLNISKNSGNVILSTDYCSTTTKMNNSYVANNNSGYVSFAANQRELNNIPNVPAIIYQENSNVVTNLSQIKNFLYLINPINFTTKTNFINAVTATNYDLLIMDLYFHDGTIFTASEILQLKNKANGGKRILLSYMSIGEAEDYRYYWQTSWNTTKPTWLNSVNPNWPGNYKVQYWNSEWQSIIYGNDNSYVKKIIDAGFEGVYLDIIDAFEYYEN